MTKFVRPKNCGCAEPGSQKYADQQTVRCSCGRRWVAMDLIHERHQFVEELLAKYPEEALPAIDQAMFAVQDIVNIYQLQQMRPERALELIRKVVENCEAGEPPPMGYLRDN